MINKNKRIFWGKEYNNLPKLNLTSVQLDSYNWFLTVGIKKALSEISPISDFTGKNWELTLGAHSFGKPKKTSTEAADKGLTYDIPLKVETSLLNKKTGKKSTQEVFLGDIPAMTEVGTFIVNGIERVVVNQLVRSPGVFFTGEIDPSTGRTLYIGEIRPERGTWLEFFVTKNNTLTVRIDRRKKFPLTMFLRAIGIGETESIIKAFEGVETSDIKYIQNTLDKDTTKSTTEAILEIYKKMRPGEPLVIDNATEYFNNLFFNNRKYDLSEVGRYKINKKLNLATENIESNWVLTKNDITQTIIYLINLTKGIGSIDDIDHLANRRVRCVGELVAHNAFRIGLLRLEKSVREKMSLSPADAPLTPSQLINARPIISSINEFFRSSQLSAILDQTNPLSEIDNLRRLSVMGTGGISRERASFSIRDINASQYGRICPVRSPEGPNIGLVTYMSLYTRVNKFGFLETPYRKVINENNKTIITNEIVYLTADDEQGYYITHAGVNISENNEILDERVPARFKGEFLESPKNNVQFIDIVPRQVVGTSASLIPFIAHDEANRALMGTHMQCQAVPLIKPESPIVGTGMEGAVVEAMARTVRSAHDGEIKYVDAEKIVMKLDKKQDEKLNAGNIKINGNEVTYYIEKFKRTSQSTCYSQFPVVSIGDKIKKGDIIIDGPAADYGNLALGQNLTIAYMSFEGLGYEDAIVISERMVREDTLTSIHIEEYEAAVVDTKLGSEETTRDIPNVGEENLANLDEEGIVVIGAEIGPNDILVGKIAPKGETELTAEERLLRAIFGEKAREIRDTSLRMPHGEKGIVVDVKILDKEKGDELEPGTNRLIKVKVAQIRKVVVGDKLAGRHGNKGVISKIVPAQDMPYLEDGTPIDVIISPLSVLARMNLGQLLEAHLGIAASKLNYKVAVPVFEKLDEQIIREELKKANLSTDGKQTVYDGRNGQPFEKPVVVGTEYIMKLIHMIEDKTHARSTGPYSLVTQQPLGGKAQMGGQRLGEMEVWALEAHRAAYTLQEMLTIKSDDVVGRAKAFEAIVKGADIPQATIPESFKVLVKELNSLCLNIIPTGVIESLKIVEEKAEEEVKNIAEKLAQASGKEIVADNINGQEEIKTESEKTSENQKESNNE